MRARGGSPRFDRIDPSDLADPATLRPAGGAVFDLHAHTSERSFDSGVCADVLVAQAAARGLDGVCLTEHNALWPAQEVRALGERFGVSVLRGMELGTDAGHVLVFGLDRYHPELLVLDRLRAIVQTEGAAMVLAHPMREFRGRPLDDDDLRRCFDGLEAINADHSDSHGGMFTQVAARLGLAAVGGSDVHSQDAVGRAVTLVKDVIREESDLVRAIRERRVRPGDLRPGAARNQ